MGPHPHLFSLSWNVCFSLSLLVSLAPPPKTLASALVSSLNRLCRHARLSTLWRQTSKSLALCVFVSFQFALPSFLCQCNDIHYTPFIPPSLPPTTQAPSFAFDKCETAQLFLNPATYADTEVVCSVSSGINIVLPQEDGTVKEFPIPYQFRTTLNEAGTHLTTEPTDHGD